MGWGRDGDRDRMGIGTRMGQGGMGIEMGTGWRGDGDGDRMGWGQDGGGWGQDGMGSGWE